MIEKNIIEVKNLSKWYLPKNKNSISDAYKFHLQKNYASGIQILDNISFELKKSEILGIIGNNGAGKSTLLKCISGMVQANSGKIAFKGKIAAIIQSDTFLNGKFSGKENIYLAGLLFGFQKNEVNKYFEEIIAFSELGEAINRAVETYSSGMWLRLAFSIVVHFPFDLLIFDEVFEVGDIFFQKKIEPKIFELKQKGISIIFVSHDLLQLSKFCNKILLLDKGKMVAFGSASKVLSDYVENFNQNEDLVISNLAHFLPALKNKRGFFIDSIALSQENNQKTDLLNSREINLKIEYRNESPEKFFLSFRIKDFKDQTLFLSSPFLYKNITENHKLQGNIIATCSIPKNFLKPGMYTFDFFVVDEKNNVDFQFLKALKFEVIQGDLELNTRFDEMPYALLPDLNWALAENKKLEIIETDLQTKPQAYIDQINNLEIAGFVLKNFLSAKQIEMAKENLKTNPFSKSKDTLFGKISGKNLMSQGINVPINMDDYFDDAQEFEAWINKIFGFNYAEHLQKTLAKFTSKKMKPIAEICDKPYKFFGLREFFDQNDGLHIHIENEYGENLPQHNELEKHVCINKQLSQFVNIENAQIGGEITLHELFWNDALTQKLIDKKNYDNFDKMIEERAAFFSTIPSKKIKLAPGDLFVFNAGSIWHSVSKVEKGKRITLGGLFAEAKDGKTYYMWY